MVSAPPNDPNALRSDLAVVPRGALGELVEIDVTLVEDAAVGVDDPPVQRRAEERLRLDGDHAQLAVVETAVLLDAGEQTVVTEMPFAEVPAEHRAGDVLAVDVAVLLER